MKFIFHILFLFFILNIFCYTEDAGQCNQEAWELVESGEFQKALSLFKKCIKLEPENGWYYRAAGWVLLEKLNQPQEALQYYKKAIRYLKDEPLVTYEMGATYQKCGNYTKCFEFYKLTIELYGKRNELPPEWFYGTVSYIGHEKLKKPESVLSILEKGLKNYPDSVDIRQRLASVYYDLKNYNKAINFYKESLEIYKKNKKEPPYWIYYHISSIYREHLKTPGEAIPFINQGLEKYPHNQELLVQKALLEGELEHHEEALKYWLKTFVIYEQTKTAPPHWIYFTISAYFIFHISDKNYDEGIKYLKLLLGRQSVSREDSDTAHNWIAYAYYCKKDYEKFVPLAKEYIKSGLDKNAVKINTERLTYYLWEAGEFTEAYKYAKTIKDYWVYENLAPKRSTLKGTFELKRILNEFYPIYDNGIYHIPLPMENEYQKLISFASKPEYKSIIKDGRYRLAVYDFTGGFPSRLDITMVVETKMVQKLPKKIDVYQDSSTEPGYYAHYKDEYFDIDNPELIKLAKNITKDCKTNISKVRAIQKWTSENITHYLKKEEYCVNYSDGTRGFKIDAIPEMKKVSDVYKNKVGSCHEFSNLFLSLCRILHIPATKVWGLGIQESAKGRVTQHYLNEVYDSELKSWVLIEPMDQRFYGINNPHLFISSSEELNKKYNNIIDLVSIRWIQHYNYNDVNCLTYEYEIIE